MEKIKKIISYFEGLEGALEAKEEDQEYIDELFSSINKEYKKLKEDHQTEEEINL